MISATMVTESHSHRCPPKMTLTCHLTQCQMRAPAITRLMSFHSLVPAVLGCTFSEWSRASCHL